ARHRALPPLRVGQVLHATLSSSAGLCPSMLPYPCQPMHVETAAEEHAVAAAGPKVTVVTPVYNGAAFIGEALASVRRQTWGNWDHVVLDNCSTDATAAIVEEHARSDARIRLHRNERHLPIIPNWNAALRLLPPDAAYCKVLHADDWLEPECLERMVAAAERYPSAGLVSAYVHDGIGICGTGLSSERELFS